MNISPLTNRAAHARGASSPLGVHIHEDKFKRAPDVFIPERHSWVGATKRARETPTPGRRFELGQRGAPPLREPSFLAISYLRSRSSPPFSLRPRSFLLPSECQNTNAILRVLPRAFILLRKHDGRFIIAVCVLNWAVCLLFDEAMRFAHAAEFSFCPIERA